MKLHTGFKPLLAENAPTDLNEIRFPVLVSPKLDGIRCIIWNGIAWSRTLKPIPNQFIQEWATKMPSGPDGELIVGEATGPGVMNRTSSGVMKKKGEPDFSYHVFDNMATAGVNGFSIRLDDAAESIYGSPRTRLVKHHIVSTVKDLEAIEKMYLALGYEGVMIRALNGPYKFGRSTEREQILLKLKRFETSEARVIDFVERQKNTNEQKRDERGYAKRSTAKAGKVNADTLGALIGMDGDMKVEAATGFSDAERAEIWANRDKYLGKLFTYKRQEITPDGAPRFQVWLSWRDEIDL